MQQELDLTEQPTRTDLQREPSRVKVWEMFDRISHRYDLLNRTLSLGRDIAWRKFLVKHMPATNDLAVLDLATGTADVLLSMYQSSGRVRDGVGLDMAGKMLRIGKDKIRDRSLERHLQLVRADATAVPFPDQSFDVTSMAFGIRNLVDVRTGLAEMYRVLRPNGRALILEFSLPANCVMRRLYLFYFRHILPRIGGIVSGDSYAYRYLNETVETFPYGEQFCELMRQVGFSKVIAHPLTFGIATLYVGERTEASR